MRLVLDTSVIVAGLRSSKGASRQLLWSLYSRQYEALASVPLFLEYEAVLKRPEHLTVSGLTINEVDIFLDGLAALITPITSFFLWRPILKDPADEMVLEVAISGRADCIVTFNIRDFERATRLFDMPIVNPSNALRRLRNE